MANGALTTTNVRNSTTAPAAFALLAEFVASASNALAPFTAYEIIATCYFAGTAPADGTDSDNVRLYVDAATSAPLALPAVAGVLNTWKFVVTTGSNGSVGLQAIGAGTAGTIYRTTVTANPLAPVILPEGQLQAEPVL